MYSVLIQNQKTMQQFAEYYPLFLDLFSQGQIGTCRWVESGRTVDTALPGLIEMVEGKEEWRAIIIRVEDENDMSKYKSVPGNAYDFYESRKTVTTKDGKKKRPIEESPVPIIRLTQMLGEVPAPELEFEAQVIKEEGKAPRPVFVTHRSEEEEEQYAKLLKKFEFDGKKPDDIILVTFTNAAQKSDRTDAEEAWINNLEISSYNFCRENRYSSNTRFAQYSYVKEGRTRKNADLFNFWTCVMLLASGDVDPSTFQAFRLYDIHADINRTTFAECLQDKYDELKACRIYAENEIRADMEKRANEKHPAPDYKLNITAAMDIPAGANVVVDPSKFGLVPPSTRNELNKWDGLRSAAQDTLEDIFRRQDRVIDESAASMRLSAGMDESQVTPLDKYERADMDAELSHIFDEIIKTQNKLSGTRNINSEEINTINEQVRESISGRITKPVALEVGFGVAAIAMIFCFVAIAFPINGDKQLPGISAAFAVFTLALVLTELALLLVHRYILVKQIDRFNDIMEDNLNLLTSDVSFYSKFVSNIVSFSRGRSFLNILKHKKFALETEYERLQRHLTEINLTMDRMIKWSEAYYVPVNQDRNISNSYVLDYDIAPRENKLYTFEHNKEYNIPLNYSGDTVISPFGFVERLVIKREELYEK